MASAVGEASSSSPPSTATPCLWTYHVFLSFRGEDTRKGFTDHLCAALERKGIVTYRDDKNLERGEVIKDELLKAIEESMFAIIVLSPNYASSAWCLDELRKIVECSNKHGLSIVPVFYGVEPSDVRHQKGSFEEALRKHEERLGQDSEKIKRWRNALTQVANYSGWDSKHQHEATLVESIAQHVHTKLIPKLPAYTEDLVGIASRVEELTRLIGIRLNDVCFIGIWGMGGIGKTTIARAVYEAIEGEFQVRCFLANVREICETYGLVQMQNDLVSHSPMNISTSLIKNVYDGKRIIRSSLCNKKVLLVLDDVSAISQLENLAGKQDWFGPGSRVIITTRDVHLLKIHEVSNIYGIGCLFQNEALHLFCLKAFKQDQPKEGYLEMSHEVVKYTGALPLALKILASYLHGRTVDVWRSAVKKIKNVPHSEILDTLKISYEGLDPIEKHIFLDIACIFKGMKKGKIIDILEKCGYNPQIEVDVLIEKSLITINRRTNSLDMHDLLEEMGKSIVIQESPNDPSKRSRLWSIKDMDLVLTQNKGSKAIQSIVLRDFDRQVHWRDITFSNISQLKFLNLGHVVAPIHLPSSLKVLHMESCVLETLLLADQQYELVEIKLLHCEIVQLWHGEKFLKKLKYLDLSHSSLEQTPDLSVVPNLETLVLEHCYSLSSIHTSLIHHKSLVVLNLSYCKRLKSLPSKLKMSSLKELILDHCYSFNNLPEFGECMTHLSRLSLLGTTIMELPISLGCLVGLSDLNLGACHELTCLPDSIHGLKFLRNLNAFGCPNLRGLLYSLSSLPLLSSLYFQSYSLTEELFPHDFCHFTSLTNLDLSYSSFVRVPIRIHELPKLRRLCLNRCLNLKFLPELPSSIRQLKACECKSLNEFEVNALSKACCIFASTSRGRGEVLQVVISGTEIPSWFVHRQKGNCVSIPLPCNFALNERLGFALCFLFQPPKFRLGQFDTIHFVANNGDRIITCGGISCSIVGSHLCILCMTNHCLNDEIHHVFRIELSYKGHVVNDDFKILSSAARWVRIEDINDLNKSETEGPKKKKTKKC